MRSLLFVPGDSERKLEKGVASDADVLILDLEDSVAATRKEAARTLTSQWLASAAAPPERICVRINPIDTHAHRSDLDAIADHPPAMIMLPKAGGGSDVAKVHHELRARGMKRTKILPLVTEVPRSVLHLASYGENNSGLCAMTWGAEDLSVVLGAATNREPDGMWTSPYRLVRDLTLIASAAADVPAIDTIFANFRDADGLQREAEAAARDGFIGKLAIHPAQVAIINTAFTPSAAAIAHAEAVIAAFKAAGHDAGVASLDGQMIDEPHRKAAERLLGRAAVLDPTRSKAPS